MICAALVRNKVRVMMLTLAVNNVTYFVCRVNIDSMDRDRISGIVRTQDKHVNNFFVDFYRDNPISTS